MAAIDRLLEWAETSERMHQLILAELLKSANLLSHFQIQGKIRDINIETQGRLYDFTVTLETGLRIHAELKVNSDLRENQIERQVDALRIQQPADILVYFLLGTTQFQWTIDKIMEIALKKHPNFKNSILLVDASKMQTALLKMLANPLENDDRDLAVVYLSHLQKMSNSYEKFMTLPFEQWEWGHWFGFYNSLKAHLQTIWAPPDAWIGYVSNRHGGFMCFSWYWKVIPNNFSGTQVFLQLENRKLCFKIWTEDTDTEHRCDARNALSKIVLETWQDLKQNASCTIEVQRPARFGNGYTMTVAEVVGNYLCSPKERDQKMDWNYCLGVLLESQQILDNALTRC